MILLPLAGSFASADGMAHVYPSTGEALLMSENAQLGVISYKSGTEMLAISVSVSRSDLLSGEMAAWMFPVPAAPEDVDIGLISSLKPFASYEMYELSRMAANDLSTGQMAVMMSQVYTIPLSLALLTRDISPAALMLQDSRLAQDETGLLISETVESDGVVAELVSTEDMSSLSDYLDSKGVSLSSTEEALVDDYVGEDYSFVVSWIDDTWSFVSSATGMAANDGETYYSLGISMEFPSERLYYPMKLTSAYGDLHVPMLVEVFGYYKPDDPRGYDVEVDYMTHGSITLPPGMESFYYDQYKGDELPDYEYTRIWVDVESSSLQEDLWMDPETPVGASTLAYTLENTLLVTIVFSVVASLVASVLMAFVVFRPFKPRLERFALLSLLNFLTIVAVWLVLRTKRGRGFLVKMQMEPEPQPPRTMFSDFLVCYSVTYIVLVVMLPIVFIALAAP
jgi:hypothetical protein